MARFSLDRSWILARSTEGGDPLRLGDAPHAFARTVFLNAQVDDFGVVTQQGGGLEFGGNKLRDVVD